MKYLLCFLFIVRIGVPMGLKATYVNVQKVSWDLQNAGLTYILTLSDGRVVYAPMMFTVIEEQK